MYLQLHRCATADRRSAFDDFVSPPGMIYAQERELHRILLVENVVVHSLCIPIHVVISDLILLEKCIADWLRRI